MEIARAQLLSSRVFDVEQSKVDRDDDVGWMECVVGTRLGCAGLCSSRVGLEGKQKNNKLTGSTGGVEVKEVPDPCDVTKGNSNLQ